MSLNPAGEVPVLVAEDGLVVSGGTVIAEYIEETEPASTADLLWGEAPMRAEIRRLVHWFEFKFYREVGGPLVAERVIKRFSGSGEISSSVIRTALVICKFIWTTLIGCQNEAIGWWVKDCQLLIRLRQRIFRYLIS